MFPGESNVSWGKAMFPGGKQCFPAENGVSREKLSSVLPAAGFPSLTSIYKVSSACQMPNRAPRSTSTMQEFPTSTPLNRGLRERHRKFCAQYSRSRPANEYSSLGGQLNDTKLTTSQRLLLTLIRYAPQPLTMGQLVDQAEIRSVTAESSIAKLIGLRLIVCQRDTAPRTYVLASLSI